MEHPYDFNITISDSSGTFDTTPITNANVISVTDEGAGPNSAGLTVSQTTDFQSFVKRVVSVSMVTVDGEPFQVGSEVKLVSVGSPTQQIVYEGDETSDPDTWIVFQSFDGGGRILVEAINGPVVTFRLENVVMKRFFFGGAEVKLNGTVRLDLDRLAD